MLQPADKKALTILGAVILASLVIIVGATTVLVRGHEKPLPTVSFQAGDHLSQIEPMFWCSAKWTECKRVDEKGNYQLRVSDHPVPIGSRALLSVPEEISAGPWTLVAEYATPRGIVRAQWLHLPDSKFTQVLKSTPDRVLLGVEVGSLAAVQERVPGQISTEDADELRGDIPYRGLFSVRTLPVNYQVTNETPLPDELH